MLGKYTLPFYIHKIFFAIKKSPKKTFWTKPLNGASVQNEHLKIIRDFSNQTCENGASVQNEHLKTTTDFLNQSRINCFWKRRKKKFFFYAFFAFFVLTKHKKMDRNALKNKIQDLESLSKEEKSMLLGLLDETKTYGLVWENKPEDVEIRLQNELPVFRELKERAILGKNLPKTGLFEPKNQLPNHILIEGDNLHALTALSFTHQNDIDVIYIDPPYNTGNKDFRYNDKFIDKEDAFRHSSWLSFMHKRLKIAKDLLNEKGVIFISIDDNEQAQLKLLCDEIFGEDNFLGSLTWVKRTKPINSGKARFQLQQKVEYILVYSKIKSVDFQGFNLEIGGERKYPFNDNIGNYRIFDLEDSDYGEKSRETMKYEILGIKPQNGKRWKIGQEEAKRLINLDRLRIVQGKAKKIIYDFDEKNDVLMPFWSHFDENQVGTAETGKAILTDILGQGHGFDTVKPLNLIKKLIFHSTNQTAKILDFFAGSGTTLHAVMQLNAEDGGNRECILVTNNENQICEEVTYIRNKKVIEGYQNSKGASVEGLVENNLRYYVCDFVGREETLHNKKELCRRATDLLCIKENCYQERSLNYMQVPEVRVFGENKAFFMLIYDDEFVFDALPLIEEVYADIGQKIKVYVFSNGSYAYDGDFDLVADKIELCALPAAIYSAYQAILPKKRLENKEKTSLF